MFFFIVCFEMYGGWSINSCFYSVDLGVFGEEFEVVGLGIVSGVDLEEWS